MKGLMIDLDNTLYGYEVCNKYAKLCLIKQLSKDLCIGLANIEKAFDESRKDVKNVLGNTAAGHSRLLYIQKTLEILGISSFKAVMYNELFWKRYFEKMKLFGGVMKFLKNTNNLGIKICIVTDLTAEIQMKKIIHLGIENYIDFIVSSEEVGCDKPSSKMFQSALEKMNMSKEDVIMVGDDEDKDIRGAEDFGIKAIYVNQYSFKSLDITNIFLAL